MDHRTMMQGLLNRIAIGVFGLLAFATLLLAIFNEKGVLQVREQSHKLTAIEADVRKLDADNQSIRKEIQALRSDPSAIEKLAREELNLVKPGEVVLVTPSDSAPSTTPQTQHPER